VLSLINECIWDFHKIIRRENGAGKKETRFVSTMKFDIILHLYVRALHHTTRCDACREAEESACERADVFDT